MDSSSEILRLRLACEQDCRLLWEWANDPKVRTAAFFSAPIPWQKHVQWFRQKLSDPHSVIYIALDNKEKPVGQVRFDLTEEDEAEVDVSVDEKIRGCGYGSLLISMGVEKVCQVTSVRAVHAFVKPINEASIRAFDKAGFRKLGMKKVRGELALHYLYTCTPTVDGFS